MTTKQILEALIANFDREFDLESDDADFMMLADAKDKLRPLFDALRARIAQLEKENESLKAKIRQTN